MLKLRKFVKHVCQKPLPLLLALMLFCSTFLMGCPNGEPPKLPPGCKYVLKTSVDQNGNICFWFELECGGQAPPLAPNQ